MRNHELQYSAFNTLITDNELVFVDFWAPWCAPCKEFSKIFEHVASRYPGIQFAKINIDDHKELTLDYGIRSIPHLMVFKDGMVIYSDAGHMTEARLEEVARKALAFDIEDITQE